MEKRIEEFLQAEVFAVAGASANRDKYGNKVLRCYLQNGRAAIPINPRVEQIEGVSCVNRVQDLPAAVESLSVVTPPQITEQVVEQALAKGIKNIWMQPGAESEKAIAMCREKDINVIADGSCLLVALGFSEGTP